VSAENLLDVASITFPIQDAMIVKLTPPHLNKTAMEGKDYLKTVRELLKGVDSSDGYVVTEFYQPESRGYGIYSKEILAPNQP